MSIRRFPTATLPLVAILLAATPATLEAAQPAQGAVVAVAEEYLVVDVEREVPGGRPATARRLFLLDRTATPAGLAPGERAAVRFTVGDDNRLHALSVARASLERDEAAPTRPLAEHVLGVLAVTGLGPQGVALLSLLDG
jgi:hypothetical protein